MWSVRLRKSTLNSSPCRCKALKAPSSRRRKVNNNKPSSKARFKASKIQVIQFMPRLSQTPERTHFGLAGTALAELSTVSVDNPVHHLSALPSQAGTAPMRAAWFATKDSSPAKVLRRAAMFGQKSGAAPDFRSGKVPDQA